MQILIYILKRIMSTIPVMGTVVFVVFIILRLLPENPAAIIAGENATTEDIRKIYVELGLDKPVLLQFFQWLNDLVHLNLGRSIFSHLPVTTLIIQRWGPTFSLALTTISFTVLVAVPLGILAAWQAGKWLDRVIISFSILSNSIPAFVLAYTLIYIFSTRLLLFSTQGYKSLFNDGFVPFFAHIILPTLTLSLIFISLVARMTRACVLEVLKENYIRTAYAKGQSTFNILLLHALPNAAPPIATTIGFTLVTLVGGVIVTESVFNIPGLGRLVLDAVLSRDYPVIQGLILFFSFVCITINLLIDLSYAFFNPRIRL